MINRIDCPFEIPKPEDKGEIDELGLCPVCKNYYFTRPKKCLQEKPQ